MYMHSVCFGTTENLDGKISEDRKYSAAGKFSPMRVISYHSAAIT